MADHVWEYKWLYPGEQEWIASELRRDNAVPSHEEMPKAESVVSGIRPRKGHVQREERGHFVEVSLFYSSSRDTDSSDAGRV